MGSNERKCLLFEKPFLIGSYYTQMIIEGCNGKREREEERFKIAH